MTPALLARLFPKKEEPAKEVATLDEHGRPEDWFEQNINARWQD